MEARPTLRRPSGHARISYEEYIRRIEGKTLTQMKLVTMDRGTSTLEKANGGRKRKNIIDYILNIYFSYPFSFYSSLTF